MTNEREDERMSITDFLLARIAEDEAAANAANGPRWASGDGNVSEGGLYALQGEGEDGWAIAWFELGTANEAEDGSRQLPRWPKMERHAHENSVHAARHDPARVLRECEAKRRIVDEHTFMAAHESRDFGFSNGNCLTCRVQGPCATLLHLASVFADHPDYRQEWTLRDGTQS